MSDSNPTPQSSVTPESPWLGLRPFTEDAQQYFFGRTAELNDLYERILDKPLTILFGQSGLGKSSLLQAALAPRLRANGFLPVVVRFDHGADAPPLERQVLDRLGAELKRYGKTEEECPLERQLLEGRGLALDAGARLWLLFHDPACGLIPSRDATSCDFPRPVLLIDQFEEIFTLGERPERRGASLAFRESLAALVENRPPTALRALLETDDELAERLDYRAHYARVLISLREDFLHVLERWRRTMPSLMENRLELRMLNGPQAFEAVVRPGQLRPNSPAIIPNTVGETIVRFVAGANADVPLPEIDAVPPLLSLVCAELNAQRLAAGADQITQAQFEGHSTDILKNFYYRSFELAAYGDALANLPEAPAAFKIVRHLVEDRLLSADGFRESIAFDTIIRDLAQQVSPAAAKIAVDQLVERRLLTVDERGGVRRIELSHDVLTPIVKASRDERHEIEELARAQAETARIVHERNRARVVILAISVALVALIGGLIAFQQRNGAIEARAQAEQERSIAIESKFRAETAQSRATELAKEASDARDKVSRLSQVVKRQLVLSDIDNGVNELQHGDPVYGYAVLGQAYRAAGDVPDLRSSVRSLLAAWDCVLPRAVTHDRCVNSVAFSPDGTTLATASADKTARLWNVATGQPLGPPLKHDGIVVSLAFSPDGTKLATASDDKTTRLWDVATGKSRGEPLKHKGSVYSATFSPDGTKLATVSDDRTVRLWDVATGEPLGAPLKHDDSVNSVAFNSDGTKLATASGGIKFEGEAWLWDVATGKLLGPPLKHDNHVLSVAFSLDGTKLATASLDETARLWDVATGKSIGPPLKHDAAVNSVVFSPDGTKLATASEDHTARLWDVATGKPLGPQLRHDDRVFSATFSPDGTKLATASVDKTVRLWDVATGRAIGGPFKHDDVVFSVVFSPDGTTLASACEDKTARLWDLAAGKPLCPPFKHDDRVTSVALSPDGTKLATGCDDKTARLWDVATCKSLGLLRRDGVINSVAFSPDGMKLAIACDDMTVRIWDVSTGIPLGPQFKHDAAVFSVAFSPDGGKLATASDDKTARLWDVATGKQLGASLKHDERVSSVAFSPDGAELATACWDKTARLWDVATGKAVGQPLKHDDNVWSVAFSPDGTKLATACRDGTARLWDVATGKLFGPPLKHDDSVWCVAFSPDGTKLATASADNTARLWDVVAGKQLCPPLKHGDHVTSLAFNPDGTKLATASWDKMARLWDVPKTIPDNPSWIAAYAKVVSQYSEDADSSLHRLSTAEADSAWHELAKSPAWLDERTKILDQCRRTLHVVDADEQEAVKNWFAAAFHLRWLAKLEPKNPEWRERLAKAQEHLSRPSAAAATPIPTAPPAP